MKIFSHRFIFLFKKFLGLSIIILGFIAMLIPFVPGILLVFAGLYLFQKRDAFLS